MASARIGWSADWIAKKEGERSLKKSRIDNIASQHVERASDGSFLFVVWMPYWTDPHPTKSGAFGQVIAFLPGDRRVVGHDKLAELMGLPAVAHDML